MSLWNEKNENRGGGERRVNQQNKVKVFLQFFERTTFFAE